MSGPNGEGLPINYGRQVDSVPEIQVVLTEAIQPAFKRWLADHDLHLFRIPGLSDEDDLPTYGIGIGRSRPKARDSR